MAVQDTSGNDRLHHQLYKDELPKLIYSDSGSGTPANLRDALDIEGTDQGPGVRLFNLLSANVENTMLDLPGTLERVRNMPEFKSKSEIISFLEEMIEGTQ